MRQRRRCLGTIGIGAILAAGGLVWASEQRMPISSLLIKNGDLVQPIKRVIKIASKDGRGSALTIVGDPQYAGAKLRIRTDAGGDQCFDLPASGWFPAGVLGFNYRDSDGPEAVAKAVIRRSPAGVFKFKAVLSGKLGPINVVPNFSTQTFDVRLSIAGGDDYCGGGTTAGALVNTQNVLKVKNAGAPIACGVAACSPSGAFLD